VHRFVATHSPVRLLRHPFYLCEQCSRLYFHHYCLCCHHRQLLDRLLDHTPGEARIDLIMSAMCPSPRLPLSPLLPDHAESQELCSIACFALYQPDMDSTKGLRRAPPAVRRRLRPPPSSDDDTTSINDGRPPTVFSVPASEPAVEGCRLADLHC
jgi:hypothetical protein